uniref:Uncharacterized protein n=1 Tax=Myoviridae sp. ctshb19 TaxID=2825194 RepID=A0A8S5UH82_9CAUD|nr:MAG TPA: hypothetical protein [Myoviridae sp. ctshb19]
MIQKSASSHSMVAALATSLLNSRSHTVVSPV